MWIHILAIPTGIYTGTSLKSYGGTALVRWSNQFEKVGIALRIFLNK